jgi:hypothetical protein
MKIFARHAVAVVLVVCIVVSALRLEVARRLTNEKVHLMSVLLGEIRPDEVSEILSRIAHAVNDPDIAKELSIPNGRTPSKVFTKDSLVICTYESPPFIDIQKIEFRNPKIKNSISR